MEVVATVTVTAPPGYIFDPADIQRALEASPHFQGAGTVATIQVDFTDWKALAAAHAKDLQWSRDQRDELQERVEALESLCSEYNVPAERWAVA
jgi:hypothetical protein